MKLPKIKNVKHYHIPPKDDATCFTVASMPVEWTSDLQNPYPVDMIQCIPSLPPVGGVKLGVNYAKFNTEYKSCYTTPDGVSMCAKDNKHLNNLAMLQYIRNFHRHHHP